MSYTVAQRTQEIGIRLALGAQAGDVLRLILGQACAILAVGGLLGLAGGLAISRMLENLLYGIGSADPLSLAGTIVVLSAVALLAGYLPARWASRLNPVETLRWE
jgi:putative ABC transport system permease protein